MTDDSPVDLSILELLNADLSGESTVGLVVDVLGSNADLRVGELAGQGEVEGGGRDDDLSGVVELGGIEVVHDVGDALGNTVPARGSIAWSLQLHIDKDGGANVAKLEVTYILKLPPTKNWRGILMDMRGCIGIEGRRDK